MARRDFRYRAPTDEELEKRANQSGYDFKGFIKDQYKKFRPERGENRLRILPQEDASHFAMYIWVHYAIGPDSASVLCLHNMTNDRCPLCEDRSKAERRGDDASADELKPVKRALVWMVNRNDEREGPMLWDMPWTIDRDLAKLSRDRKTGETYAIDHPDEGYDIVFDREGEGVITKYTGMAIARRASSIEDEWLDFIRENPLSETLVWRDFEEINDLYGGVVTRRDDRNNERRDSREDRSRRDGDERRPDRRQEQERPTQRRRMDDDSNDTKSSRDGTDPYDKGEKEAVRGEDREQRGTKSTVDALREKFEKNRQRTPP